MHDPTRTYMPTGDPPTRTFHPDGVTVAHADSSAGTAEPVVSPDGYELLGEIGRGGMGFVYRGWDRRFDRQVAVKVLHPRYTADSPTARRFLDEACITGQLQHPGIPPVHHVGHLPDGRPFLAMKLIDGRTFAELLAIRPDPAHDRVRLLAVFEGVCQAVGYAHANGVIHRDLKPQNFMVGAFGEVQVMDWGLAKRVRKVDVEPRGDDQSVCDDSPMPESELTQAGSIFGTPAYMPPEQARGDPVNERADVFSLGAVLCEILTGSPPHPGGTGSLKELLAHIAKGDLSEALHRLSQCDADAEVVALAKRCLAVKPADRPADAHAIAAALADHRAGVEQRLREVEIERTKVVELQHRRRLKKRFLFGIAVLLLAVQGLVWWVYESNKRTRDLQIRQEADKAREVTTALAEVNLLREQGLKQADDPVKWKQTLGLVRASLRRAESAIESGWVDPELPKPVWDARLRVGLDESDCALLIELDRLPELNEIGLFAGVSTSHNTSNRYAAAFRKVGLDPDTMTDAECLLWLRGHRFRERITLGLRDWIQAMPFEARSLLSDSARLLEDLAGLTGTAAAYRPPPPETRKERLSRLADEVSDPFAREWWQAVQAGNADKTLQRLAKRPEFASLTSRQLSSLACGLQVGIVAPDADFLFEILRTAYTRFPAEFWVNHRLGKFYQDHPQWKVPVGTVGTESLRHLTAAVAARPNSAFPRAALALHMLMTRQDVATVETHLKNAIAVDPNSAWPHMILASSYAGAGQFQAAIDTYVAGVRADPDNGFLLVNSFLVPLRSFGGNADAVHDRLIAEFPDRCESWLLRSSRRALLGDARGQLADLRETDLQMSREHPQRPLVDTALANLTKLAVWEERLPEVLTGGPLPEGAEWGTAARYCVEFDKNYAWAAELADRALSGDALSLPDPIGFRNLMWVTKAAEWAFRASDQPGIGSHDRERFRRMALRWLNECADRLKEPILQQQWNAYVQLNPIFRRYTNATELKKQSPEEQAAWERFVEKASPLKK